MIRIVSLLVAASFPFAAMAQSSDAKPADSKAKAACCQKGDKTASGGGCCSGAAKSASCKSACESIAKDMPRMSYVVGDKTVCCPKEAEKLANGDTKAMKYKVADKTYDNAGAAYDALTAALDGYYGSLMTVKYAVGDQCVSCPTSAAALAKKEGKQVQYRVAAFTYSDQAKAEKALAGAKAAADKVTMQMRVGDKSYECPMSADGAAKANGGKVEYVVGEQKLCCPNMAKAALAQARIDAATKVLSEMAS
jgi:hypothetical protein